MKNHRIWISPLIAFVASLVALQCVYPWSTYGRLFSGRLTVALSYVWVALALAALSGAAGLWAARRKTDSNLGLFWRAIGAGALTAAGIITFAIALGPLGVEIPRTHIAMFFEEWDFLRFVFFVGFPITVLTMVVSVIAGRVVGVGSAKSGGQGSPSRMISYGKR